MSPAQNSGSLTFRSGERGLPARSCRQHADNMPTTFNCPASGESSKQSRQAAETCAPQMACCASRLGSLTAKALVDCRPVVPPHSSAWVHQAVAQFRVTVPVEARPADVALAAEQPAIGRPSQRALSTTLDNPPAYRRRHCLSYYNVRDHKVARRSLRMCPS